MFNSGLAVIGFGHGYCWT